MQTDISQHFIFDNADIRGERVQLSKSLPDAFALLYPPVIKSC